MIKNDINYHTLFDTVIEKYSIISLLYSVVSKKKKITAKEQNKKQRTKEVDVATLT